MVSSMPSTEECALVAVEDDDRFVGLAQLIHAVQQPTDLLVHKAHRRVCNQTANGQAVKKENKGQAEPSTNRQ